VNVNEMDLVRRALDVTPWPPEAYERAQAVLRGVMAESGPAPEGIPAPAVVPMEGRVSRARIRRGAILGAKGKAGIGAGVAAAAAAAAVITLASSPSPVAAPAASAGKAPVTAPAASAGNLQLAQLADKIVVSESKLPGNASLEIRNGSTSSAAPGGNGVDLLSDSGTSYWALTKSGLSQAVADRDPYGSYKGDIAAALYAANGNITTARARMAVASFAPGTHPRKIYAPGAKPITREQQADNQIWSNSLDALNAGAANPQVRAGVLRLLSTVHGVTVTSAAVAGQPAITLAKPFRTPSGTGHDVLVINASTGLPIVSLEREPAGGTVGVTFYHVFRVTLADVAAGTF
jgi:hypothetical protein